MRRAAPIAVSPAPADAGTTPIAQLPGVGPALAAVPGKLGLQTVQDLWFHLPLRYEDRTRVTAIRDLRPGATAQVEGLVEAIERGFRYRPQLRVAISDDSQQTLSLRFFHFNKSQVDQLAIGTRVRCYGEARHGKQGLEMVHPQYRRIAGDAPVAVEDCLTPVYPTTQGLGQARLSGVIERALQRLPADAELVFIAAPLRKAHKRSSLRGGCCMHRPRMRIEWPAVRSHLRSSAWRLKNLAQHLSLKRLR